jgi:uncharacterized protein (DUF2147 family)
MTPARLLPLPALAGLALFALAPPALAANEIFGTWQTPAAGTVRVGPCGAAPCGLLVDFPPPAGTTRQSATDVKNRDAAKRSRKLLNVPVIWDIAPGDKAGTWSARVYDPRRGVTAKATATLQGDDRLSIRGCVRMVVQLCETEVWRRAN